MHNSRTQKKNKNSIWFITTAEAAGNYKKYILLRTHSLTFTFNEWMIFYDTRWRSYSSKNVLFQKKKMPIDGINKKKKKKKTNWASQRDEFILYIFVCLFVIYPSFHSLQFFFVLFDINYTHTYCSNVTKYYCHYSFVFFFGCLIIEWWNWCKIFCLKSCRKNFYQFFFASMFVCLFVRCGCY